MHNLLSRLLAFFNDACIPPGDTQTLSCIRIIEFDSKYHKIEQDYRLGATGTYLFYPALTVIRTADLVIEFGASSSTLVPSIYASGQTLRENPGNYFDPVTLIIEGVSSTSTDRYGDYQGASIEPDPADIHVAWTAGQINYSPTVWGTSIDKLVEGTLDYDTPPETFLNSAIDGIPKQYML
jgi:hypothetical protein